jgi:hypothetical protein
LEALERSLAETNRKIADLTGNTPGGAAANPQQQGELANAEMERRRLSVLYAEIHHELDRDAAQLGRILYGIDLLFLPLLLSGIAITTLSRRHRRASR